MLIFSQSFISSTLGLKPTIYQKTYLFHNLGILTH